MKVEMKRVKRIGWGIQSGKTFIPATVRVTKRDCRDDYREEFPCSEFAGHCSVVPVYVEVKDENQKSRYGARKIVTDGGSR